MKTITLLNYVTGTIEIIRLNPDQEKNLEFNHSNDAESWLTCEFKKSFKSSDCSWMITEDYPEIYEHHNKDKGWCETQVFTTP